jgi:uncharacterized protein YbjQ (UPF0145 family)
MLKTTTPNIEGKQIVTYHGLVSGEAILGANLFKDLFASIRDIVGGRSQAYERELQKAKDMAIGEMESKAAGLGAMAIGEMESKAAGLGANAIIGIDLDYETIGMGGGGNMLMVSASGTAVTVR